MLPKLSLTSVKIEESQAIIKTIHTDKTVCILPDPNKTKAIQFAQMIEEGAWSHCSMYGTVLKEEEELLMKMCGSKNFDLWFPDFFKDKIIY